MPRPTATLRSLYIRALAATHLLAVGSLAPQLDGLVGPDGILPHARFMDAVAGQLGVERYWRAPSLLWFMPGDGGLDAVVFVSMFTAVLLLAGLPVEGPALLLLWACWLTLCTAGQLFTGFQWDALLAEATFAALLLAAWRPGQPEAPRWAWWVQRWLALRLMFFGGLVKLTSGDPSWRDGTALHAHFWTQPLPNPLSLVAAELPSALLTAGVALTFVVELVLPFVALLGRTGRHVAFAGFTLLMGLLFATGNYGYFQILSVVVCSSLLDDDSIRALPFVVRRVAERPAWHLGAPVGLLLVAGSLLRAPDPRDVAADLGFGATRPSDADRWPPAPLAEIAVHTQGLRIVNRYGLFARMTTERPEVWFEGSWDGGQTWRPLPLVGKVADPAVPPIQVAPHMPRLVWQLWFAGLSSCQRQPWVLATARQIADGAAPVMDLFAPGTFADGPPDRVRTLVAEYRPDPLGVWIRGPERPYCPVARRGNPPEEAR